MTFWYAGSLLILALLTLAGHWSVQRLVSEGRRDAAIINIAGRQRMLSQKIAKNVALLANAPDESAAAPLRVELASALSTWRLAHEQLVFGDADVGLPATTDPAILASMGRAGTALGTVADAAALSLRPSDEPAAAASAAVAVAMTEPVFLAEMERAVGLYEQRAAQHVAQSERTILAFGGATLLVFAFVAAFIFHPLVRRVRRALRQEREVAEAAVLLARQQHLDRAELDRYRAAVLEAAPERERLTRANQALRTELAAAHRRLLAHDEAAAQRAA